MEENKSKTTQISKQQIEKEKEDSLVAAVMEQILKIK